LSCTEVQGDSGHEAQDIEYVIEAWKVSRVKLKKQTMALFKSLSELAYDVQESTNTASAERPDVVGISEENH